MNCARCCLPLPPGASHAKAEDCVAALQHALAQATRCRACGTTVPLVIHPACVAKQAAKIGVDRAVDLGVEKLMSGLFGHPPSEAREDSGGKKFEP